MGPAVSRPDDWNGVPIVTNSVFASMGPAVSRPDDLRPAQAERTAGVASMGPAVSRPDDVRSPSTSLARTACFNGAGRFTAG